MHKVTISKRLNHKVADVWQLLDDFGAIHTYNPGVESAEVLTRQSTGLGARRICRFYDGTSLEETITQYAPGRGYSFELSNFALPLKSATSHFEVAQRPGGGAQLSVTLEFVPKFGPLGWVMAKLIMRPMLTRALNGLTKGVEDHMRTGLVVGQDGALVQAAA